mgnify:FL=1
MHIHHHIALIFQWTDQKLTKKAEKQVIQESTETEKELLKKYIRWNEETKKRFAIFSATRFLYYETQENNGLAFRTHLERDITKIKKVKRGSSFHYTSDMNHELKKVELLIKDGVVYKVKAKEGEPFTFKLKLTKYGKILLKSIEKINELSES